MEGGSLPLPSSSGAGPQWATKSPKIASANNVGPFALASDLTAATERITWLETMLNDAIASIIQLQSEVKEMAGGQAEDEVIVLDDEADEVPERMEGSPGLGDGDHAEAEDVEDQVLVEYESPVKRGGELKPIGGVAVDVGGAADEEMEEEAEEELEEPVSHVQDTPSAEVEGPLAQEAQDDTANGVKEAQVMAEPKERAAESLVQVEKQVDPEAEEMGEGGPSAGTAAPVKSVAERAVQEGAARADDEPREGRRGISVGVEEQAGSKPAPPSSSQNPGSGPPTEILGEAGPIRQPTPAISQDNRDPSPPSANDQGSHSHLSGRESLPRASHDRDPTPSLSKRKRTPLFLPGPEDSPSPQPSTSHCHKPIIVDRKPTLSVSLPPASATETDGVQVLRSPLFGSLPILYNRQYTFYRCTKCRHLVPDVREHFSSSGCHGTKYASSLSLFPAMLAEHPESDPYSHLPTDLSVNNPLPVHIPNAPYNDEGYFCNVCNFVTRSFVPARDHVKQTHGITGIADAVYTKKLPMQRFWSKKEAMWFPSSPARPGDAERATAMMATARRVSVEATPRGDDPTQTPGAGPSRIAASPVPNGERATSQSLSSQPPPTQAFAQPSVTSPTKPAVIRLDPEILVERERNKRLLENNEKLLAANAKLQAEAEASKKERAAELEAQHQRHVARENALHQQRLAREQGAQGRIKELEDEVKEVKDEVTELKDLLEKERQITADMGEAARYEEQERLEEEGAKRGGKRRRVDTLGRVDEMEDEEVETTRPYEGIGVMERLLAESLETISSQRVEREMSRIAASQTPNPSVRLYTSSPPKSCSDSVPISRSHLSHHPLPTSRARVNARICQEGRPEVEHRVEVVAVWIVRVPQERAMGGRLPLQIIVHAT